MRNTILIVLIVMGIFSHNTLFALNFINKKPAAHQLIAQPLDKKLVSEQGAIIINGPDVDTLKFIDSHEWFIATTCTLYARPALKKYRTRKGYMT
jgi:hypothetical protein